MVITRHITYKSSKSVHWCDLCTWVWHQKRKRKNEPEQWQTGYLLRPPMSSDRDTVLRGRCPSADSYSFQVWSKSAQRLPRCGVKFWVPAWLIHPCTTVQAWSGVCVFAVRCTAGSEAEGKTTEVAPEPVEAEPAEGEQGLLLLLYLSLIHISEPTRPY